MANTTDMIICCFSENGVVNKISAATGIVFNKVSDGKLAGGTKVLSLEAYGACYRSLGKEKIQQIIDAFNTADFLFPELASLTIDDDDQVFNGVIVRGNK